MIRLPRLIEKESDKNISSGVIFIVPDRPYKVTLKGKDGEWVSHVLGEKLISTEVNKLIDSYLNPMTTNSRMMISESTESELILHNKYRKKVILLGGFPTWPI
ncbi:hypothetical protein J4474_01455 [Candidatus Pacearchaeota archaeon]|nr:hypothetical protein [Candidatus Pacearchaeota archaeon]